MSLPALMAKEYDGRGLKLGRVLARAESYTRRAVTYRSEGLSISGIINVRAGTVPSRSSSCCTATSTRTST